MKKITKHIHQHKWKLLTALIIILLVLLFVPNFIAKHENEILAPFQKTGLMTTQLPAPDLHGTVTVEAALNQRRSIRDYKDVPLTLQQISQLLWAAQGITGSHGFRTAPSAGALYPLEIYLVAGKVNNLPAGVYHYIPDGHALEKIASGDKRNDLANAAQQKEVKNAAVDIVVMAVYSRTIAKYGIRGERYVHLEAGHAAQNICLQVVPLQLGTVTVGAFDDEMVKKVLGVTDEDPLYILPVGKI